MSTPIPRNRIPRRRVWMAVVATLVCVAFSLLNIELDQNLWHANYFSGYVLLGSIVFLTAFNLRKKLTFLPNIGSASMWMQLHIWVGLSTFLIFGFHISWRIPNGMFESLLAALYMIVACSGLYGLFVTRFIPRRLTNVGQEVVFERIPALRLEVAYEARQTALGSLSDSDVIARFYTRQLLPFFEKPRGASYFLFPSSRRKRQLISELSDLNRYLSAQQREVGNRLSTFVQKKDDLDYHYALQSRLKLWLFIHIGFTYSLLAVSIMHTLLVHAFIGGGL